MNFSTRRKLLTASHRLSYALSVVLHPALMPTWIFTIVFFWFNMYELGLKIRLSLLTAVFLTTFLLPLLLLKMISLFGLIKNLEMPSQESRKIPFLILGFYYIFPIIFFIWRVQAGATVNLIIIGYGLIIWASIFLNFFYKVSVHALGMGGSLGILFGLQTRLDADFFGISLFFIFLSGWLLSARLRLKAHTSWQVWSGFLVGLGLCLGLFYYFNLN